MTTRLIALLRGVNVGGHNRVTMAQQRQAAEALGCTGVRVHLQTGNIVLCAPDGHAPQRVAADLRERLRADCGVDVPVLTRTPAELAAELAANPYPDAVGEPKTLHCVFLSAAPEDTGALDAIDQAAHAPDSFRLLGRVLYLHCPGGLGRSRLAPKVTAPRLPGVTATARNWNTATKLLQLAEATR
ncbi:MULTISPECIES: DUF1697 domain-containing protein [Streptomyces]|uniref:DUF1697 domain-containing protein n=1 Tax=Streptomyces TaxID=1883 RepID=UPI0022494A9E|nr:DUF1697 domain-containing protein [Streptomyces sp. JHD 1]MCX2970414.1 DUF1697 domain-containing protein [Streptomyces sp. JHD 1]